MKKMFLIFLTILLIPVTSFAITYNFVPNPPDLYDLSGRSAYNWGIYQAFDTSNIVSAELTFLNIVNLYGNPGTDVLYLNLLDNAARFVGVQQFPDSVPSPNNYFSGQGVLLASVTEIPVALPPIDYTYTLTTAQIGSLNSFTSDGYFGIGIDPNCRFFNDGITLTINTSKVPEPGLLLIMGCGMLGLGIFSRRKFRK